MPRALQSASLCGKPPWARGMIGFSDRKDSLFKIFDYRYCGKSPRRSLITGLAI
jgi:hypothetical protein